MVGQVKKTTAGRVFRSGEAPPNKGRRFPPEILTEDEARQLIRTTSSRAPTGIRNRALLVVMYRGGLRLGEALALKAADVDFRASTIRVLHGKGDRSRVVGLDPGAMALVDRWVEKRAQLGIRTRALFCTLAGELDPSYVRKLLARLAGKAGIEKRVNPSCAAALACRGAGRRGRTCAWPCESPRWWPPKVRTFVEGLEASGAR